MEEVQLHLDLAGIRAPADRVINRAVYMAHLGLRGAVGVGDMAASLGTEMAVKYRAVPTYPTSEALVADYRAWILGSVFRDVVEAVGQCCTEAYLALLLMQMVTSHAEGSLSWGDYQEKVLGPTATFRKTVGLPKKLDKLNALSPGVVPDIAEHVKSLNLARNCLVHRHGVVGQPDVNTPDESALRVRWRNMVFIARGPDGTEERIGPGSIVQGGWAIYSRVIDHEKVFPVRTRIEFTEDEFVGACFGVTAFAAALSRNVEAAGTALGWTFTPPAQEDGPAQPVEREDGTMELKLSLPLA